MLDRLKDSKAGAITVDRMVFGTNGHTTPPADLVMRAYTEREVLRKWDWLYTRHPVSGKVFQLWEAQRPDQYPGHSANVDPASGFIEMTAYEEPYDTAHEKGAIWEPLRLNHYTTKSYTECLRKLDAKFNRQSETTNWRTKMGRSMCDQRHNATSSYLLKDNGRSYDLSSSPFPDVVERLIWLTPSLVSSSRL